MKMGYLSIAVGAIVMFAGASQAPANIRTVAYAGVAIVVAVAATAVAVSTKKRAAAKPADENTAADTKSKKREPKPRLHGTNNH